MGLYHILKEQNTYPLLEMDQNTFAKLPEYSIAVPANKPSGFLFKVLLIKSQQWYIGRVEGDEIKFYRRKDVE